MCDVCMGLPIHSIDLVYWGVHLDCWEEVSTYVVWLCSVDCTASVYRLHAVIQSIRCSMSFMVVLTHCQ